MAEINPADAGPTPRVKGIPVPMGGATWIVPPLSLGTLEDMQERLASFKGGMDAESVRTVIDAAWAALLRNYPGLERTQVRDMLDVGNMEEVFTALMDVSGALRKAAEAGEAQGAEA